MTARLLAPVLVTAVTVFPASAARSQDSLTVPAPPAAPAPEPSPELLPEPSPAVADQFRSSLAVLQIAVLRERLHAEHARLLAARRHARRLAAVLRHQPSVREAIQLACSVYGSCDWLWRVARCESGLTPGARNRYSSASGLFQFLPSTWAGTPFAGFSIWSPYANALAAGWMIARGRGGEWVCR